jgi:hypothetical protein
MRERERGRHAGWDERPFRLHVFGGIAAGGLRRGVSGADRSTSVEAEAEAHRPL